ncbi:MAG: Hsp20/alpha crystallin family protein [Thermoprotei archaeon]|nr:MAG: Hsp20/alpha crystallin family protein [Thermoprotei archaeon]RLF18890.1 MAG: Hsp20/alpha crystallin family protein [Thermoprotei archaeon]
MSFWDDWFRRRRWGLSFFEEMSRMMEEAFRDLFEVLPKELYREYKLPDGSTVRTLGPIVYGYTMTIGPDGKPVIREFGNVKPSRLGLMKPSEEREPLVDVIPGDRVVHVVAEMPGVSKEDIKLEATEDELVISAESERRKYHKVVSLPVKVDPKSAKASYKNGVLEVTLNKAEEKPKGERIKIE